MKVVKKVLGFVERANKDHVGAYSAQAAYFLILSFIPFVLFLTTLIRFTPVSYNEMREAIMSFVPVNMQDLVLQIVSDVYRRNTVLVPVTFLGALWSAGKGLQAITNGLNTIYHVKETRNWLITRIISVFYTMLFAIALIFILLFTILGERLKTALQSRAPYIEKIVENLLGFHMLPVIGLLFLVFLLFYIVLPNRKASLLSQIPGAMLTAVAWVVFSYMFSLYFSLSPGFENMYGSLTVPILLMLWLYFLMIILLYGALVNTYFENDFREARRKFREKRRDSKEENGAKQEKDEKVTLPAADVRRPLPEEKNSAGT